MLLQRLESEIMACKKCPRICNTNPFAMPHIHFNNNISDLKFFVVARNPGIENDCSNISEQDFMQFYREKWLECRIARYFKKTLGDSVILNNMFFTNVCKCSSPKNTPLLEEEIQNCEFWLERQLETIKPDVILAFGNEAKSSRVLLRSGIRMEGFFHPSYFIYQADKSKELAQFNRIREIVSNVQNL